MPELLLELLSEEIPARMQARAAEDLKRLVCERLEKAQLTWDRAESFVTPRRLALVVEGLPTKQPGVQLERKGPRVGSPAPAIEGFLKANGFTSLDELEIRETEKGQFYFAVRNQEGADTALLIAGIISEVLHMFPWPKSMRWGPDDAFRWIRPLHTCLIIFENASYNFDLWTNKTTGHRFLAPGWFEVRDFADYKAKLRNAKVIIDQAERRQVISDEARRLATTEGLRLRDDEGLLEEVTGLVEWPVPMLGSIDPEFMDVPPEVLITAMRAHQKYFSLLDAERRLAPRFVLVANTEAEDGGRAIAAGNERVLRARLSDAKFFWDEDRKRTLESRVPKLAERVFHAKLGSDLQRTQRLKKLVGTICAYVQPEYYRPQRSVPEIINDVIAARDADPNLHKHAEQAAWLCKADLTTAMVSEFPELQGVMGRHYALHDGEPARVADAIAEHYSPQGPSDSCPTAPVSVAVALADKIDTLVGFFVIGEKPTGSKDPYALRRAALGAIRLIIENGLRIPLCRVFEGAADGYKSLGNSALSLQLPRIPREVWESVFDDLLAFFIDRLKVHLREHGVRHDLIAAVFAADGQGDDRGDLVQLLARVDALRDFLDTDDGANLLTAYRRASNIVRIEENKDGTIYDGEADGRLLEEQQEIELYRSLAAARAGISDALEGERFGEAMAALAGLRAPVDAFFDHVTVNCRESHLRVNRLRLLSRIRSALGGVADFSQIEG
jgi:glycyl-tRNA synthetase beta chain